MRWEQQRIDRDDPALLAMPGLLRSVRTPEFAGMVFHEVTAKSALNKVSAASRVPFRWTVNPYRGCSHACRYCFARNTHTYLDLDAGDDFDRQVIVKVNTVEVLRRELRSPRWAGEQVAMGTNTDPYQRAEGRYQLMAGVITALAEARTPFSILTKGTLLGRDLPTLQAASREVSVGLSVSIALLDDELRQVVEPGAPTARARLDLVRRIRDAGFDCGVLVAPVLPCLTDGTEQLDMLLGELADAGATAVTVIPLHLRRGSREWYFRWLHENHPDLVERYETLYRRGAYLPVTYRRELHARVRPLLCKHGLDRGAAARESGDTPVGYPEGGAADGETPVRQPTLL